MMFVDGIAICGGKEVDTMEYLDTWRKSLAERMVRVSRPKIILIDFAFEQNGHGNRELVNILGEQLKRVTYLNYIEANIDEGFGRQQPRSRHRRDAYIRRRGNERLLQVGGLLR